MQRPVTRRVRGSRSAPLRRFCRCSTALSDGVALPTPVIRPQRMVTKVLHLAPRRACDSGIRGIVELDFFDVDEGRSTLMSSGMTQHALVCARPRSSRDRSRGSSLRRYRAWRRAYLRRLSRVRLQTDARRPPPGGRGASQRHRRCDSTGRTAAEEYHASADAIAESVIHRAGLTICGGSPASGRAGFAARDARAVIPQKTKFSRTRLPAGSALSIIDSTRHTERCFSSCRACRTCAGKVKKRLFAVCGRGIREPAAPRQPGGRRRGNRGRRDP